MCTCSVVAWWREGTTNLGPEHRPLQPVAPPSSVLLSSYLLQAHSEIQGPLAVGKWRLRTVERVCRSVGGLQTHGVGPFPAPLRRHLFPHQCAADESPKIPILLTQGPGKQAPVWLVEVELEEVESRDTRFMNISRGLGTSAPSWGYRLASGSGLCPTTGLWLS